MKKTTGLPGVVSVVVPVYNEREGVRQLVEEIGAAFSGGGVACEIILVDYGSSDGTDHVLDEVAVETECSFLVVHLRRNFGKATALCAGFRSARGEIVITLDGELQDDPAEIPRFLSAIADGLDVVSGYKKTRRDPWHKVVVSRVFNWMVRRVTGTDLHDVNCGFKAIRKEVLSEIHLYGELHRFIPVMAHWRGFRIGEIVVEHRARPHGTSKYGIKRYFHGLADLLTVGFISRYETRPSHLFSIVGAAMSVAGVFFFPTSQSTSPARSSWPSDGAQN